MFAKTGYFFLKLVIGNYPATAKADTKDRRNITNSYSIGIRDSQKLE